MSNIPEWAADAAKEIVSHQIAPRRESLLLCGEEIVGCEVKQDNPNAPQEARYLATMFDLRKQVATIIAKQCPNADDIRSDIEYAVENLAWHYDGEAKEDDDSPDDMTAHVNGLVRRKLLAALAKLQGASDAK